MSSAIRLIGPVCNRCEGVMLKGPFLKKRERPAAPSRQAGSTFSMHAQVAKRKSFLPVRPLPADRDPRAESDVRRENTSTETVSHATTGTAAHTRAAIRRALRYSTALRRPDATSAPQPRRTKRSLRHHSVTVQQERLSSTTTITGRADQHERSWKNRETQTKRPTPENRKRRPLRWISSLSGVIARVSCFLLLSQTAIRFRVDHLM